MAKAITLDSGYLQYQLKIFYTASLCLLLIFLSGNSAAKKSINSVRKKIIVIGSGFGGLAAAIRLAARGYDVEIFEKRDKPGGRAYVYEVNGFKFDGGPTVITAPFLFEELFELAGKKMQDYFTL